jgi:hypothetical protein
MTVEDVFDSIRMDFETQFQQFSLDLVVSHPQILTRDADNQRLDIRF